MDAISLLKSQHREIEALLEKLVKSGARATAARRRLFEQLADLLATHSALEEGAFYPAVNARSTEEPLLEALEMHLAIKRVLADLMTCEDGDPTFKAKSIVLRDLVRHHLAEEEQTIFPLVEQRFTVDTLDEIAAHMREVAEDLKRRSPRHELPAQTDRAARLDAHGHFTGVIPEYRE